MARATSATPVPEPPPFADGQIEQFLAANARSIRADADPVFAPIADALDGIRADLFGTQAAESADLESLEQKLTALEQKMVAIARVRQPDDQALAARRELDGYLRPYKG